MSQAQLSTIIPKLHRHLMPTLLMMYVLAFLDRANVGFAKAGLAADAGVAEAAFAFGASIFFIGYAVLEVPSNLILHRVGAKAWMSRIMITWGLLSAATAFVQTPTQFHIVRFLLGVAEAGFFPGIIYYLTYWYPSAARARSVGLFYYGAPLALTFGGPLSGFLVGHDAFGLKGWQIMFLVEGLAASLAGVAVIWLLKNKPEDVTWLDSGEKATLQAALAQDNQARDHLPVLAALRDSRLLHLAVTYFLLQAGFYGLTFQLPSQIARLMGDSMGLEVGLVSAIPWACALIGVTIIPPWCDRRGNSRGVGAAILALSGCSLALAALAPTPLLAMVALSAAACGLIVSPCLFWTLPTGLLAGAAAAGGIGLINALGNLGGFVAPNLRAWLDSATGFAGAGMIGLAVMNLVGACLFAFAPRGAISRATLQ